MSITPIILCDLDAPWIDRVHCLGRQLAPGDVVSIPVFIDQSSRTPSACYEIVSIERAHDSNRGVYWRGVIRWDYGGLDEWDWSDGGGSGLRYCVVGGDKLLTANTVPSSVAYISGLGWDYRVGRWE